jgi:DNA-binding CsgD family transcriptional regulator/PAS domain-containing protein
MRQEEQYSQLIGDIYDAALNPTLWEGILARVETFVGGAASMIFWQDSALVEGQRVHSHGDDPEYTNLYFQKYIKLNPIMGIQHLFEIGCVELVSDHLPYRRLARTRFYQEWMKPQNYVDNAFAILDKSASSYATFAIARTRSQGFAGEATRHRMNLLVPHIRRAVLIGKTIDFREAQAAAFEMILDQVSAGIFLLDERGIIVHSNRLGESLLKEGRTLFCSNGRLASRSGKARGLITRFCTSAKSGDRMIGGDAVCVLLRAADEQDCVAHFLPLAAGARRKVGRASGAVAAVFVRKAAPEMTSPLEAAAQNYKLTPRESQVLHGVLEVGGVADVAGALGISEATVKTHLQHLFDKIGVRRKSDLFKVVSAFSGPVSSRTRDPDC